MPITNILLAADKKYIVQILVLLYSLFENNPGKITIHFFYSDLTSKEVNLLTDFVKNWAGEDKEIIPYCVKETANGMKVTETYPKEIYYRIFAIEMLPESVEKILYLDADVIVKGSLKELYEESLDGYAFAAAEDIYGLLCSDRISRLERLGISAVDHYVNSGVLLFNEKYLKENCATEKLKNYIKKMGHDISFPDQDALNALYYDRIKYVPWEKWNCIPMTYVVDKESGSLLNCEEVEKIIRSKGLDFLEQISTTQSYYDKAVIVHYAGSRKPWIENQGDPGAVEIFEKAFWEYLEKVEKMLKI